VRLHHLRHGAASLRLAAGADIGLVSKILGHSTTSITAYTYSHLLDGWAERPRSGPPRWCRGLPGDWRAPFGLPIVTPAAPTRGRSSESAGHSGCSWCPPVGVEPTLGGFKGAASQLLWPLPVTMPSLRPPLAPPVDHG